MEADLAGGDTGYWEHEWSGIDLEAARRIVGGDPMIHLLEQYLPKDGPVLETGCGSGPVAEALADCGYAVVGLHLGYR